MKLRFLYDLQKDVVNYKIASRSVNNPTPTNMQARYIAEYGEIFDDMKLETFITGYIAEQKIDMANEISHIEDAWRPIEQAFILRMEKMFGIAGRLDDVRVFLTTDTRCAYNIDEGFFFASVSKPFQNRTIMHELFHFWTWWVFREEVEGGRMTMQCYNDVKESLTELLNIEYKDLLREAHDDGYPQHKEMRAVVRKTWEETQDIKKVFAGASRLCSGAHLA